MTGFNVYTILKELCERTSLNRLHPVGSIYLSMDSTDPKTLFGGGDSVRWERIQGRFLLGAGANEANSSGNPYGVCNAGAINRSAGEQGGEVSHTLSAAESGMPAHEHSFDQPAWYWGEKGTGLNQIIEATAYTTGKKYARGTYSGSARNASSAHNNMPPYLAVYMWKRVS